MSNSESSSLQAVLGILRGKGRLLDMSDAIFLVKEAALALQKAPAYGDLNPNHIFISPEGAVTVRELGRAKQEVMASDASDRVRFLAPERVKGGAPNVASDLFALGLVLWRLLFGRDLFNDAATSDLIQKINAFAAVQFPTSREIPPELRGVLSKMLARDPSARGTPQSAASDLEAFLKRHKPSYTPKSFATTMGGILNVSKDNPLEGVLTGNRDHDLAPLPSYQAPFPWKKILILFVLVIAAIGQRYYGTFQRQGAEGVAGAMKVDLQGALSKTRDMVTEVSNKDFGAALQPQQKSEDATPSALVIEGQTVKDLEVSGPTLPLKLNSAPSGARIFIDGQPTKHITPTRLDLPANKTLSLVFKLEGYRDCPAMVSAQVGSFTCRMMARTTR